MIVVLVCWVLCVAWFLLGFAWGRHCLIRQLEDERAERATPAERLAADYPDDHGLLPWRPEQSA